MFDLVPEIRSYQVWDDVEELVAACARMRCEEAARDELERDWTLCAYCEISRVAPASGVRAFDRLELDEGWEPTMAFCNESCFQMWCRRYRGYLTFDELRSYTGGLTWEEKQVEKRILAGLPAQSEDEGDESDSGSDEDWRWARRETAHSENEGDSREEGVAAAVTTEMEAEEQEAEPTAEAEVESEGERPTIEQRFASMLARGADEAEVRGRLGSMLPDAEPASRQRPGLGFSGQPRREGGSAQAAGSMALMAEALDMAGEAGSDDNDASSVATARAGRGESKKRRGGKKKSKDERRAQAQLKG